MASRFVGVTFLPRCPVVTSYNQQRIGSYSRSFQPIDNLPDRRINLFDEIAVKASL